MNLQARIDRVMELDKGRTPGKWIYSAGGYMPGSGDYDCDSIYILDGTETHTHPETGEALIFEVPGTIILGEDGECLSRDIALMAQAPEMVSIIKELQAQLSEYVQNMHQLKQELSAKDDHLNFIWRWVERGKWDKNTGLKTAIDILAHYDAAPWYGNRKEWDTTHKEYDKEITEFVSDRAKLAEKDALIAELQNRIKDITPTMTIIKKGI